MACVAQPVCILTTTTTTTTLAPSLTTTGPLLLGCSEQDSTKTPWQELPPYKDEHQVGLDVNRAFVYYPKNGMPLRTALL
jgi:hypothetical protein